MQDSELPEFRSPDLDDLDVGSLLEGRTPGPSDIRTPNSSEYLPTQPNRWPKPPPRMMPEDHPEAPRVPMEPPHQRPNNPGITTVRSETRDIQVASTTQPVHCLVDGLSKPTKPGWFENHVLELSMLSGGLLLIALILVVGLTSSEPEDTGNPTSLNHRTQPLGDRTVSNDYDNATGMVDPSVIRDGGGRAREAVSSDRQSRAETLLRTAKQKLDAGKYDDVIASCDSALEAIPNRAEAFYIRGVACAYKEQWELAIANHQAAIQLDSRYQNILNPQLSRAYLRHPEASAPMTPMPPSSMPEPLSLPQTVHGRIVEKRNGTYLIEFDGIPHVAKMLFATGRQSVEILRIVQVQGNRVIAIHAEGHFSEVGASIRGWNDISQGPYELEGEPLPGTAASSR